MEKTELLSNWNSYCKKFLGDEPSNFSEEKAVFEAKQNAFPEETGKIVSSEDWLETLNFTKHDAKGLLGPVNCDSQRIRELRDFLRSGPVKMAFDYEVGRNDPVHVIRDEAVFSNREIWFIGDIHGDLLAFQSAIAFINSNSKRKPIYVFLGDLFDRHAFGLNVILEVVDLFKKDPDSVFMIAGNHDDGLAWEGDHFTSKVTPQQFTEYLNEIDDELVSSFVSEVTKVLQKLPVGLVLPNGLFATHGGVPSRSERSVKNIWDGLNVDEIKSLIASKRSEFQRNRFMAEVASGSKLAPDYSWVEIINFSYAIEKAYGAVISTLLCGHDHGGLCRHAWFKSNFKRNDSCNTPERVQNVLNMTSMVLMEDDEKRLSSFMKRESSFPSVARYVSGTALPRVYSLEFSNDDIGLFYEGAYKTLGSESLVYVEKHLERLQDLKREIQEDLDDNEASLEKKKKACEEPQKELDVLNSEMDRFGKVLRSVESNELDSSNQISGLKTKRKELEESLASIPQKIEKVDAKIKDVEEKIEEVKKEIVSCENLMSEDNGNSKNRFQKVKGKVKKLLNSFEDLSRVQYDQKQKDLQEKLEKLKLEIDCCKHERQSVLEESPKIQTYMSENDALLEKAENQLASERKKKDDVMKEIENLKVSLRLANQKVNDLIAAVNNYENKVQQNKVELSEVDLKIAKLNSKVELYNNWISKQG